MEQENTILIVDDKQLDRDGISFLIKQHGLHLNTITSSSGKEALEIMRAQPVHILLTDIKMPEMDGNELIKYALAINPDLKVIIFSSYENFDYAHKAMDLGVTKYLLKPVRVNEFVACLKAMIELVDSEREIAKREMYYKILTGRSAFGDSSVEQIDMTGYVFLLDFVSPYFNQHSLDEFDTISGNGKLTLVPLDEYQCAFIASAEDCVYPCINELKTRLHNKYKFVLVYGGYYENISQLSVLMEKMENYSSSKFYLNESTVFSFDDLAKEKVPFSVRKFMKKAEEICKMILRGDTKLAEAEIDNLFNEFHKQIHIPIVFAKYICMKIVCDGLDSSTEKYNEMILRYISEVEHSTYIDDLKSISISIVNQYAMQGEEINAIDRAMEIIHTSYQNNISLESVAANVYLSTCYLSYLFKKITGMNFIKYLTSYRVNVAKDLLRTSSHKINTICEMVGFSNVSYFCQIFKNHTGFTPAQYRGNKS